MRCAAASFKTERVGFGETDKIINLLKDEWVREASNVLREDNGDAKSACLPKQDYRCLLHDLWE